MQSLNKMAEESCDLIKVNTFDSRQEEVMVSHNRNTYSSWQVCRVQKGNTRHLTQVW